MSLRASTFVSLANALPGLHASPSSSIVFLREGARLAPTLILLESRFSDKPFGLEEALRHEGISRFGDVIECRCSRSQPPVVPCVVSQARRVVFVTFRVIRRHENFARIARTSFRRRLKWRDHAFFQPLQNTGTVLIHNDEVDEEAEYCAKEDDEPCQDLHYSGHRGQIRKC